MPKTQISQPAYHAVATHEDAAEEQFSALRTKVSSQSRLRTLYIPLIGTVTSFWFGLIAGAIMFATHAQPRSASRSFVPDAPLTKSSWDQDFRYAVGNRDTDHFWDELMPVGNGRVLIANADKYGLPPGEPIENQTEGGEIYAVSVTHQLHCLAILRTVLIDYGIGVKSHWAEGDHIFHCIDYLRHGIICAADTTIEWPKKVVEGNETKYLTDGQGSQHQCKDWDAVKSFLEANRVDEAQSALMS